MPARKSSSYGSHNKMRFGRPSGFVQYRRGAQPQLIAVLLAGFIILLGGLGLKLLQTPVEAESQEAKIVVEEQEPVDNVEIIVPVREIIPGTALEPSMFRKDVRRAVALPQDVVRGYPEVHGLFARSLILANEPITRLQLTEVKPSNPITPRIREGFRAVTIRVDATSGVEGWARPGARVDVSWIASIRGAPAVTSLVQNAEILSAERSTDQGTGDGGAPVPSTVTLLVTAADAQKIQLASTAGTLTLSLRGSDDGGKYEGSTTTFTVSDLLGDRAPAQELPRQTASIKVRSRNGTIEEFVLGPDGKLVPAGTSLR